MNIFLYNCQYHLTLIVAFTNCRIKNISQQNKKKNNIAKIINAYMDHMYVCPTYEFIYLY